MDSRAVAAYLEPMVKPAFENAPPQPRSGGIAARAAGGTAAPWVAALNPEQRLAVETTDGPVLVLAGAGTGKTRVLTTRIAHLIATNRAFPSQILSVTFTNKAAREMKERIGHLVGAVAEGMPWLGTFHSISAKILRRHAELLDLRSDFTILDTDDQIRLMKQVIAAEGIDEKRWPARMLSGFIDSWKNRGLAPKDVAPGEAAVFANGKGGKLYAAYQDRLKSLNAVDFGDLLLHCLTLFREHADVLSLYHERFRYILVDEYQDTNTAQYLWLRLLAQGRRNIACVGDDDQSIYGWRGAEVDNILRFEHDFPGATVIRLERNYRSTGHILATASKLIARNETRLGKTLRTEDELGEKVTITGAWDSQEEARLITDEIEAMQLKGDNLAEIADAGAHLRPDARARGALRPDSACPIASSAARASTSAPRSATPWPICAASSRPPTTSPSSASSTCPSAGWATPPSRSCTTTPARPASRCCNRRAPSSRATSSSPRRAPRCASWSRPSAAGRSAPSTCRRANSPSSFWRRAATPRCGRRTARPTPPAGSKT
jgi:hypothetical protein